MPEPPLAVEDTAVTAVAAYAAGVDVVDAVAAVTPVAEPAAVTAGCRRGSRYRRCRRARPALPPSPAAVRAGRSIPAETTAAKEATVKGGRRCRCRTATNRRFWPLSHLATAAWGPAAGLPSGWPTGLPAATHSSAAAAALQGSSAGSVAWQRRWEPAIADVATVAPESPSGIAIGNRPVRPLGRARAADPRSEPDCAAPEGRCRAAERAGCPWAAGSSGRHPRLKPVEPADPVVSAAAMAGTTLLPRPPSATASAPTRPT